jgi:hypothetical protein
MVSWHPHVAVEVALPLELHHGAPLANLALDTERVAVDIGGVAIVAGIDNLGYAAIVGGHMM